MRRHIFTTCGVGLVAASAAVGLVALPATAGQVKTFVVLAYTGAPSAISVTPGAPSVPITVSLDYNTCLAAFNNKSFGIVASDDNTSAVTVSPASHSGMLCGDSTVFTVTGIANGGATIRFDIDAPPGLQNQTTGASVNVTASGFPTNGGGNPPGHVRPAAPAVANGFLNSPSQTTACYNAYGQAKNWHGQFIRDVAKWAAANHLGKAKNDTSRFPTDNDWLAYVQLEVNTLCA